ncbi:MAG: hypothetical protein ACLP7J_05760 [Streptosporangiaceae bacterium]
MPAELLFNLIRQRLQAEQVAPPTSALHYRDGIAIDSRARTKYPAYWRISATPWATAQGAHSGMSAPPSRRVRTALPSHTSLS